MQINFLNIFFFLVLIGSSLLLSEIIKKIWVGVSLEALRKIPHIFIGLIFASTPYFLNLTEIVVFSIILFFSVLVNKY